MSEKIFSKYITLKNGRILRADEVGLSVFCFDSDPDYWARKKTKEADKLDF